MHSNENQLAIDETKSKAGAPRTKKIIYTFLKIIVSGFLIYWILKGTNFTEIISSIKSSNFVILGLAFSLHFVGYYISAVRWKLLLEAQQVEAKTGYLVKSYIVSVFLIICFLLQ